MSFQCLIDKSAVVWENEVRSTFLSGLFWSTRDPIFRNLAGKPDLQTGKIKVLKSFQATIMNSSVDQVKKKRLHFFKEILTMLVFRRITVFQFTIVIQCVYYHV